MQAVPLWVLVTAPSAVIAAAALAVSGIANGVRSPPVYGLTEYILAHGFAETMTAATFRARV